MNGWVEWMNEWMNGWVNENDLLKGVRLRTLENKKMWRKPLKWLDLIASTKPMTQKTNFDIYGKKLRKISCKTFHRKTCFTYFGEFLYNLLPKILTLKRRFHGKDIRKNKSSHRNFRCQEYGIFISQTYPYLGASSDGVISSKCFDKEILEKSCPWTSREKLIKEYVTQPKTCLTYDNSNKTNLRHM